MSAVSTACASMVVQESRQAVYTILATMISAGDSAQRQVVHGMQVKRSVKRSLAA